jgi:hypothetical protein
VEGERCHRIAVPDERVGEQYLPTISEFMDQASTQLEYLVGKYEDPSR